MPIVAIRGESRRYNKLQILKNNCSENKKPLSLLSGFFLCWGLINAQKCAENHLMGASFIVQVV